MISIVIPTYNRAGHLKNLYCKLDEAMIHMGESYELILVDDASKDDTAEVIREICKMSRQVKGVILTYNVGQQNATLAGIRHASHEVVVTLDDDLKYDPATINQLLDVYNQGYDVVYGIAKEVRRKKIRRLGTAVKEMLLFLLCKKPKEVQLTSYKVMGGSILDHIRSDEHEKVYLSARLLQKTKNIVNVEVASNKEHLATTYSLRQLIRLTFTIVKYYGPKLIHQNHQKDMNKRTQYVIKELV